MSDKWWQELKALEETPYFRSTNEVDRLLRNAIKRILEQIGLECLKRNKSVLSTPKIKAMCKELGINVSAKDGKALMKIALPKLYARGKLKDFLGRIEKLKSDKALIHELRQRGAECWKANKHVLDTEKLHALLSKYRIQPSRKNRLNLLRDAFPVLHEMGTLDRFTADIEDLGSKQTVTPPPPPKKKDGQPPSKDQLRNIYRDVCGHPLEITEKKLESYFPDDDCFERNFELFVKQFGIQERRKRKRRTWLKKVAVEISSDHGGAKLFD